jgi:hypothetical protein
MHVIRACRAAALRSSFTSRLPSGSNLVSRHLERRLVLSRCPPRLPTLTNDFVSSSRRNLSTSTPPRRAQYSRFDDDPNRPPPQSLGFQKRDIIIYTLGAGSVVYYIFQCVMSHLACIHLLLMSGSKQSRTSPRDGSMALHGCEPEI